MKICLIVFGIIAAVAADVSHLPLNRYLAPAEDDSADIQVLKNDYLPPAQQDDVGHELAEDGYRYKSQRRVVYRRNRRDVSHLTSNLYLPPVREEVFPPMDNSNKYLPPVRQVAPASASPVLAPLESNAPVSMEAAPAHELADDGYHYKTQRRVVYRRNRRDVSHLKQYLPPAPEVIPIEVAPIHEVSNDVVEDAVPAHELADDGYRYKTQRRIVYRRNRRDVSHLTSNDYLPPVQEDEHSLGTVAHNVLHDEESVPAHDLTDDGYHYKTQRRRIVYRRNRRDVSHLPSNEYLPPGQASAPIESAALRPVAILDEAVPAHELADDGYHYKTQRRTVYRRNRRDVSHLPSNEYLPPAKQSTYSVASPNVYLPPVQQDEPVPAHHLADDGYHYKTLRRVVFRRN